MDYKGDLYYLDQVLDGNTISYSHVVDRHKERVFNLALRICGNREEAEEIAQDAFLKAFRSLRDLRRKSSFTTWLYRIVYNTSISHLRSRKNVTISLEEFPVERIDFEFSFRDPSEAEAEYRNALVNFAMQKITDEERGLITLYYYEEMNFEEISDLTGISKPNIRVKLFRARQKMLVIIENAEKKKLICHE